MESEGLNDALRERDPDEPVPAAIERWLLRIIRTEASKSALPSFVGASIESLDFEGTYPDTRIVTCLRLADCDGNERLGGFTDELWFTGDDGEVLEAEALIEAVNRQPFVDLYLGSLDAAVGHLRGSDPLIPRRVEQDRTTGSEREWIDLPIGDL